jgi:RNA polymerase sigma factor (sigma-70 family)
MAAGTLGLRMPITSLLRPRRPVSATDLGVASDRDLVDNFAQNGDQGAFAALVARHGPRVFSVCTRVLKDRHAAEDAFQATFLVLAQKAATLGRPDAVGSWLYGVALRTALSARTDLPPPVRQADPEQESSDPSAQLAQEELRLILDEELWRLAESERALLVMVYLEGKTHEEAADAMGYPRGSVAWRLTKARESLRSRLARRGVSFSIGVVLLLGSLGNAQAVSPEMVSRTAAALPPPRRATLPKNRKPVRYALAALLLAFLLTMALGVFGQDRHTSASPREQTDEDAAAGEHQCRRKHLTPIP